MFIKIIRILRPILMKNLLSEYGLDILLLLVRGGMDLVHKAQMELSCILWRANTFLLTSAELRSTFVLAISYIVQTLYSLA